MRHKATIHQEQPPPDGKIEAGRFYRTKDSPSILYAFHSWDNYQIKLVNIETGNEANSPRFKLGDLELIRGSITLRPEKD